MSKWLYVRVVIGLLALMCGVLTLEAFAHRRGGNAYKEPRYLHHHIRTIGRHTPTFVQPQPHSLPSYYNQSKLSRRGPVPSHQPSKPRSRTGVPQSVSVARASSSARSNGLLIPLLVFMGLATTVDGVSPPNACNFSGLDYEIEFGHFTASYPSTNTYRTRWFDRGATDSYLGRSTRLVPLPSGCGTIDAAVTYLAGCVYEGSLTSCLTLANLPSAVAAPIVGCAAFNSTYAGKWGDYGLAACHCTGSPPIPSVPSGCSTTAAVLIYSSCYGLGGGCSESFCQRIASGESGVPCETPTPRMTLDTTPNSCNLSNLDHGRLFLVLTDSYTISGSDSAPWFGFGVTDAQLSRDRMVSLPDSCVADAEAAYLAGCIYQTSMASCLTQAAFPSSDVISFSNCAAFNSTYAGNWSAHGLSACRCAGTLSSPSVPSGCSMLARLLIYSGCYSIGGCSDGFCQSIASGEAGMPCATPTPRMTLDTTPNSCNVSSFDYATLFVVSTADYETTAAYSNLWFGFGLNDRYSGERTRMVPLPDDSCVADAEAAYLAGCAVEGGTLASCLTQADLPNSDVSSFNGCSSLDSTSTEDWSSYGLSACMCAGPLSTPNVPSGCGTIARFIMYGSCYAVGGCPNSFCQSAALEGSQGHVIVCTPTVSVTRTVTHTRTSTASLYSSLTRTPTGTLPKTHTVSRSATASSTPPTTRSTTRTATPTITSTASPSSSVTSLVTFSGSHSATASSTPPTTRSTTRTATLPKTPIISQSKQSLPTQTPLISPLPSSTPSSCWDWDLTPNSCNASNDIYHSLQTTWQNAGRNAAISNTACPIPWPLCSMPDATVFFLEGCADQLCQGCTSTGKSRQLPDCLNLTNLTSRDQQIFLSCFDVPFSSWRNYGSRTCNNITVSPLTVTPGCEALAKMGVYAGCFTPGVGSACPDSTCQYIAYPVGVPPCTNPPPPKQIVPLRMKISINGAPTKLCKPEGEVPNEQQKIKCT